MSVSLSVNLATQVI